MQKNYIIKTGKAGSDRLKKLTESTWETTENYVLKAGLKKGMKVLDIACGNGIISQSIKKIVGNSGEVLAFDFDPAIIKIAKNNDKSNVNFFVFDILKDNLNLENQFDFIFVRFFLSHISNVDEVLNKIKKLLKKGGILYIEDVDFSGHFSYPQNNSFDKYIEYYKKVSIKRCGNPFIGRELYQKFIKQMYNNIEIFSTNTCFAKGVGKEMAVITLEAIFPTLIKENYSKESEREQIISDLRAFTKKNDSIISLPRLFHCFGTK